MPEQRFIDEAMRITLRIESVRNMDTESAVRVREIIADALSTAATAPAGHIIDENGVCRRVLGTLPVTADGAVACPGGKVWPRADLYVFRTPDNDTWTPDEEAGVIGYTIEGECSPEEWDVTTCYSSHESAEQSARAAEKRDE